MLRLIRSRFLRLLGFGLCLLAAAVSSLASGATLILCEEPDGCVEIELVASGAATSSGCSGHEHELPASNSSNGQNLEACQCADTVIACSSDTVRPDKGGNPSVSPHDVTIVDAPSPRMVDAWDSIEIVIRPAAPSIFSRPHYSQRSVVLRI